MATRPTPDQRIRALLPTTLDEARARGWEELDVVLVSGDAYVDHPSFGAAVIGRVLEAEGYRVGVIAMPDHRRPEDFRALGRPRLFFGVTAGTIDSMVTNFTAAKRKRRGDVYRPRGADARPNRATIAYTAACRGAFPGVPVVIGGLEASGRRLAYYDFWDDAIRRSILVDAKADLLVWGMGERQALEVAQRLKERTWLVEQGRPAPDAARALDGIPMTCVVRRSIDDVAGVREVASYEETAADRSKLVDLFEAVRVENSPKSRPLAQRHGDRFVVQYPPHKPSTPAEVDHYYDLPYTRDWHPRYDAAGGVPALEPVRWSINTHRGCMADCSFCSITFHQGRSIQQRTPESVVREAAKLASHVDFKGTISDVGGPTANMYGLGCKRLERGEACLDRDCVSPDLCPALRIDSQAEGYRKLLEMVRGVAGVKHAFVASGIRYDMLEGRSGERLFRDLVEHHTSGRMKLAPEHASDDVLRLMNKPSFDKYERFEDRYRAACGDLGKDQYLVNYFIAGHPGTTLAAAVELFERLVERNYAPEQVQEFIPLPMTRAGVQYATGVDPITKERVHVPKSDRERRTQKALMLWKDPENRSLCEEALRAAGRADLIAKLPGKAGRGSLGPRPREERVRWHDVEELDVCA
ncbi:MAG TPA: YgiQ family radical SAM protein [Planctomycetota bacterium]|nr:YgiQ family radical SAM protein [Planctomycetota bacterium]